MAQGIRRIGSSTWALIIMTLRSEIGVFGVIDIKVLACQ